MRRGFRFTPWTVSSEPASSVAATSNGAADEKSPGISTSPSVEPLDGRDRDPAGLAADACARAVEQDLGVVAGRQRLEHRRLAALGVQAREQHGRLDLRARDGKLVRDRLDRCRPRS